MAPLRKAAQALTAQTLRRANQATSKMVHRKLADQATSKMAHRKLGAEPLEIVGGCHLVELDPRIQAERRNCLEA